MKKTEVWHRHIRHCKKCDYCTEHNDHCFREVFADEGIKELRKYINKEIQKGLIEVKKELAKYKCGEHKKLFNLLKNI